MDVLSFIYKGEEVMAPNPSQRLIGNHLGEIIHDPNVTIAQQKPIIVQAAKTYLSCLIIYRLILINRYTCTYMYISHHR